MTRNEIWALLAKNNRKAAVTEGSLQSQTAMRKLYDTNNKTENISINLWSHQGLYSLNAHQPC